MKQSADEMRWAAVESRDHGRDGRFVYAVTTTGIFCRPSCPSRRPKRSNVHFYSSADDAERAGFRACLRCKPNSPYGNLAERAVAIAKSILDSSAEQSDAMDLSSLAKKAGISAFHLQRHFKRIVGISPKVYLTKKRSMELRKHLRTGVSVLRATYESGFNSPSRAYAAAGAELGMTPSAYRKQGEGVDISYWTKATTLGRIIIGATVRGVCAVLIGESDRDLLDQLRTEFPRATLHKGGSDGSKIVSRVVGLIEKGRSPEIELDVAGTAFQWKVWDALRKIPVGETRTYGEVARSIGSPRSARAVGRACATNRAAILIPCHRVVRGDGVIGEYRWGSNLKKQLLEREATK